MINAIIIDDEAHCIRHLQSLLQTEVPAINLLTTCSNINDGIKALFTLQPQLVFLDVQIGNQTGFDLLQQIEKIKFDVIFTTAYDKYAVQAFKFSALDYLLKPIDAADLKAAINKLEKKLSAEETSQKLDVLFHNLKSLSAVSKKICVPVINGFVFLNIDEIIRCKSDVNYTTICLKDKTKLVVAKTLKEFEEMLKDSNFYRIHNSHLVNLSYIKSYNKGKGGFITMTDNSEIEVSSRRKDEFLKKLASM